MEKPESPQPERPTPERRPSPTGNSNNLIWYLLALGVGTLFLVAWFGENNPVEISYGQLLKLIEQGSPDKHPSAAIEVEEGPEGRQTKVRYSELTNLKFGPHEITGKVTREAERGQAGVERGVSYRPCRPGKRQQRVGEPGEEDGI